MQSDAAPTTSAPGGLAGSDASLDPEAFRPLPKRDPRLAFRLAVAAGGLAVALAGLGIYVYQTFFYASFSPPLSAPVPAAADRTRAAAGAVGGSAQGPNAAQEAQVASPSRPESAGMIRDNEAPPPGGVLSIPSTPPPVSATSAPIPAPRVAQPPREGAAVRAAPKPQAIKPAAVAAGSCSEALAAMGLCTPAAPRRARSAADSAATPAAAAAPAGADCREGVAALGLCAPAAVQRKE